MAYIVQGFISGHSSSAKENGQHLAMLAVLKDCLEIYAFMLTDSCALRAVSSALARAALFRWLRSFMNETASV